jgi:hypothetical protein
MTDSIKALDEHNANLQSENVAYENELVSMRRKINDLKSSYGKVVEENEGLMSRLSFWFWLSIIASVLVAVFVPGGSILVKRFWGKVGGLALSAGQAAVKSCKGMSTQLARYAETLNDEERKKFKIAMKGMAPENLAFWDKIRDGRDPVVERLHEGKEFDNGKLDYVFKHAREFNT